MPGCGRPGDPHHFRTRGAHGEVDERNLVPLCREHHTECHTLGRWTFARKYGLDWEALLEWWWSKYQRWLEPEAVW